MTITHMGFLLGMGGAPGGSANQSSPVMMIGWPVIMVALFYFLMIRPQQRKEKERRELINNVKSGDRVVFGGGLIGVVANIKDQVLTVKIADNTKVEVLRASVTRVLAKDEEIGTATKE